MSESTHLPDPSLVPEELREHDRWVCWRREIVDGRPTKVPIQPSTGLKVSVTNTASLTSFDAALASAKQNGHRGVGFVFVEGEGYFGIDIDGCIDDSGEASEEAMEIVHAINCYTEISPSGRGIKIFGRGTKPTDRCKVLNSPGMKAIEVYDRGRYFTVTGNELPGNPCMVSERQEELDALCARLWPSTPTRPKGGPTTPVVASIAADPDDDRLLDRARHAANGAKFAALYDRGDTSFYGGDDSAADLALCSILWFWTGNKERVDRLFRGSALYREKWERDDYRERTINKASEGTDIVGQTPPPSATIATSAPEDVAAPCAVKFALTDLGNAERMAAASQDHLRYCVSTGHWLEWDGVCWREDDQGSAHRHAARVVREMFAAAARMESPADRAFAARWSIKSEARQRLDAMVAIAATRPELVVRASDLDSDAYAFNCLNGTIDLRTGQLRAARPDDLITKLADVWYDQSATCPTFLAFLDRIFAGDAATIGFVQRFLGMCLTGDIQEQFLPIFHGPGANGKSVLCDLVMSIMGGYATLAPPSLLTDNGRSEHPTEIADLLGRRLVIASESEEGAELKLQQIKRLTGDARLKGRFMRQDYFEFARTHKTIQVTNNKPRIRENSEAVWRRLRIVPFAVVIPEGERDPQLLRKLMEESSGVLNWLVEGCLAWRRMGVGQACGVESATQTYRHDQDDVARFVAERCEREPVEDGVQAGWFVPWAILKQAYLDWCDESGVTVIAERALQEALDRLGFTTGTRRVNSKPTKVRLGVRLVDSTPGGG
jgi:putative DNA primase/helicase